ncbi:hypothetical protein [Dietzia sp. B32]|uniref:hypothetical protein n=1 Tax=Dietzia sp. B32 TaxID=2915130 RepID=UPI0021ADF863|nr:hypothetical protein [Dietzia sp. B32]UVE93868.1 hypothetical protein L8M95_09805 [Dietzia sp. B32]
MSGPRVGEAGAPLTIAPLTLALGPPDHGVTRFALDCARAAGTEVLEVADVTGLAGALAAHRGVPLYLHATDSLFGADPDDAASTVERLARDHPVGITLHDVPQPAEGAERCRRRTRAYQRMATVAGLVVVSSEHERHLCADAGIAVDAVIPLPVPDLAPPADLAPDERSVGVFGFLHPGKAVDVVAEAVAALATAGDRHVSLRLLGQAAEGHDDYVRAALETARAAGARAEVTGRIDDDDLARVLGEVTVPVALFRNVSASGSLNTWAASGRRPLVYDSDYTREMERRHPGSLLMTDGADLAEDLRRLLDDPSPTRREAAPSGTAELGRAYRRAWEGWLA